MKKIIIPAVACLAVLVLSIYIMQTTAVEKADDRIGIADVLDETIAPAAGSDDTEEANSDDTVVDSAENNYPAFLEQTELVIGNPDAPVTIYEFSSLTCPHCAHFHASSLPALKKDYIDTGKVKFVLKDFPLNKPAVSASLLLKCVPTDKRYDFLEMLFEQQRQWAFDASYATKLKQYASLLGISSQKADECMNDVLVEREMFNRMRESSQKYGIDSTPSFIIFPGAEKISGAQPYGVFSTRIEALLSPSTEAIEE